MPDRPSPGKKSSIEHQGLAVQVIGCCRRHMDNRGLKRPKFSDADYRDAPKGPRLTFGPDGVSWVGSGSEVLQIVDSHVWRSTPGVTVRT